MKDKDKPLTIREKVAILLVFYMLKIVAPYEYEYQFTSFYDEIKELIKTKEQATK